MTALAIAVVGEDEGHFRAVVHLFDASAADGRSHIHDGEIDWYRTWRGLEPSERWYKYDPADARDLRPFVDAYGRTISPLGLIKGEPLKPEASMWRKVLILLSQQRPQPDMVILARDLDGQPGRVEGMNQVRKGFEWPFPIVLATPQPEIEAWHVSGFVPDGPAEATALEELRKAISFDPTKHSHRLTSHPNDAETDAKRVLEKLCKSDTDREMACLSDRQVLFDRGEQNMFRPFLEDLKRVVVVLFGEAT